MDGWTRLVNEVNNVNEDSCSAEISRLRVSWKLRVKGRECRDVMEGRNLGSRPTETPYAENGTYGVVGGWGVSHPLLPDLSV